MNKTFTIIGAVLLCVAVAGGIGYALFTSPTIRETVVQQTVARFTSSNSQTQTSLIHAVLGFEQPRTYLVLFANNTELRPAGGFLGSYATIRFINGAPQVLKVEGTEALDLSVDYTKFEAPPEPLKKYLGLNHWQFRDSNWSPDFRNSSEKGLAFYKQENGVAADDIDGVIMITPTVVERVLEISGPITVKGVTFTSSNFTRTLEDEVEFSYERHGLDFGNRKQILKDLVRQMVAHMMTDVFKHWSDYTALAPKLLNEKQIALYSKNSDEQKLIESRNWAGALLTTTNQDYVQWVDANLGALKTDAVMQRSLSYSLVPAADGYQATVAMELAHRGVADKFTSRYRDYARVFVPEGSTLIRGEGFADKKLASGIENGKQWFGGFVSVDPGKTKTLKVVYLLPKNVVQTIKDKSYNLVVQKQLGTLAPQLTLQLNFGKKVVGARPGEGADFHGDTLYSLQTDLLVDRAFAVTLE